MQRDAVSCESHVCRLCSVYFVWKKKVLASRGGMVELIGISGRHVWLSFSGAKYLK
jgi:hypothetical protein